MLESFFYYIYLIYATKFLKKEGNPIHWLCIESNLLILVCYFVQQMGNLVILKFKGDY